MACSKIIFLLCVICLLLPATVEIAIQLYLQTLCDAHNNQDGPTVMLLGNTNFITFLWIKIPVKLTCLKGISFIIGSLFFISALSFTLFGGKGFPTCGTDEAENVEIDITVRHPKSQ
jgi:hypothetical protein